MTVGLGSTASVAVTVYVTGADWPATVGSGDGTTMVGAVVSRTLMVSALVECLPHVCLAVHEMVVSPSGNAEPGVTARVGSGPTQVGRSAIATTGVPVIDLRRAGHVIPSLRNFDSPGL